MIVRDKFMPVTARTVAAAIAEFNRCVRPRLVRLYKAYDGEGAIKNRVRAQGLPNHRLAHAYPRYIVTMAAGYLLPKQAFSEMEKRYLAEAPDLRTIRSSGQNSTVFITPARSPADFFFTPLRHS